ncbi:long-chain-fatty-acid--CoA ligase [Aromatoleum aromaticum]|uniref:long-chain-fatty-acid--CoA ligase n=1 Tax=Aromatoleum aromaticum TaxID=551760 RepID=UPI001459D517|nr:long-chain-fatty-acid--CoA ligase [Aromatoleum aromaticum]NMG55496.1 long-chain-fatty-acid--CoA ligase [Aromatoleum aromaticum]
MWLYADIASLADIPRYHGRTAGDRVALMTARRRESFRELDEVSSRIANLIIGAGLPRGTVVGFVGKNSIEYFDAVFGAAKAACPLLPLNWRLSPLELQGVIEDSGTPLILVDREYSPMLAAMREKCAVKFEMIEFDSGSAEPTELTMRLAACSDVDPRAEVRPDDTALLLYTSGTTGEPKGVQLTHGGLNHMRLCEHMEPVFTWQPEDVMMLVMPNFHLVGTGLSLQGLYNGVPLTILPGLDIPALLATIERDKPTICCLVPTAIQMIIDHPAAANVDLSSLRLVMYAGSPITAPLLKRAMKALRCEFMQFYGATETCGAVTLLRPEQHDLNDERKLKACGTPIPLVDVKIVSAAGDELPTGEIGEFVVRSPAMFKGYLNKKALTDAVLLGGWYRTGDAGYRDADGLLYLVDRTKDMIISGGENVYSTEVEQALSKHPAVSQVAVIGLPDERWGERVTAIVVPTESRKLSEDELVAHCRELIAAYKAPKQVIFTESLPMTPTGKVLKTALRKQFAPREVSGV